MTITVDDVIDRARSAIEREKERIQTQLIWLALSHRCVTTSQIEDTTCRLCYVLQTLHPEGGALVQQWIDEVLEPLATEIEPHTCWQLHTTLDPQFQS